MWQLIGGKLLQAKCPHHVTGSTGCMTSRDVTSQDVHTTSLVVWQVKTSAPYHCGGMASRDVRTTSPVICQVKTSAPHHWLCDKSRHPHHITVVVWQVITNAYHDSLSRSTQTPTNDSTYVRHTCYCSEQMATKLQLLAGMWAVYCRKMGRAWFVGLHVRYDLVTATSHWLCVCYLDMWGVCYH
jgi:hypothetical protein